MSNIIVSMLKPGFAEWSAEDNPGVINAISNTAFSEDDLVEEIKHRTDSKVILPDGTELDGNWTTWMAEEDARLEAASAEQQA